MGVTTRGQRQVAQLTPVFSVFLTKANMFSNIDLRLKKKHKVNILVSIFFICLFIYL